jgi:hypothetical protein
VTENSQANAGLTDPRSAGVVLLRRDRAHIAIPAQSRESFADLRFRDAQSGLCEPEEAARGRHCIAIDQTIAFLRDGRFVTF